MESENEEEENKHSTTSRHSKRVVKEDSDGASTSITSAAIDKLCKEPIKYPPSIHTIKAEHKKSNDKQQNTRSETKQSNASIHVPITRNRLQTGDTSASNNTVNKLKGTESVGIKHTDPKPSTSGEAIQRTTSTSCKTQLRRNHDIKRKQSPSADSIPVYFPDYKTKKIRVQSFRNWPKETPNGETLADANCFYKGADDIYGKIVTDRVWCYQCGYYMCDFKPTDDPKKIHKHLVPNCSKTNWSC